VVLRILGREPALPGENRIFGVVCPRPISKRAPVPNASPRQDGSPGISVASPHREAVSDPRPQDPMPGRPLDTLAAALQRLRRQAGYPSTRTIGRAISLSHTTVAQALNGSRRPKWEVVERIVCYLGGNVEQFRPCGCCTRNREGPCLRRATPADGLVFPGGAG